MTSATAAETKLITADELLRLDAKGVRGELIRGVLCETMPTGHEHGRVVINLGTELRNFVKTRKLGSLTASDSGVWLERDPDTVREPDIAYFSTERMPLGVRVVGYAETPPDLVVEVVSPSNTIRDVNDKAFMWLGHGVRLVWLVYPYTRTVDVYQGGRTVTTLTDDDSLDGLDVLPGFACAVSEIFDD